MKPKTNNLMKSLIIIALFSLLCPALLMAGGVGPPPNPMGVPLDGGVSVILLAAGAYIGYRALKKDDEK
ncbi:MAG: hypothetical protein WD048_04405 [Chitinophagales bacterium]